MSGPEIPGGRLQGGCLMVWLGVVGQCRYFQADASVTSWIVVRSFAMSESAILFAYVCHTECRPLGRDLIYEMNRLGSKWLHPTRPSFAHSDHNSARRYQPRLRRNRDPGSVRTSFDHSPYPSLIAPSAAKSPARPSSGRTRLPGTTTTSAATCPTTSSSTSDPARGKSMAS